MRTGLEIMMNTTSGEMGDKCETQVQKMDVVEECPSVEELTLEELKLNVDNDNSTFNWRKASQMMKGPRCWKCYMCLPYFKCQNCGRQFHQQCVSMVEGFPAPIFDKQISIIAASSTEGAKFKLNLLKCPCCLVETETRIAQLRGISQEELNLTLSRFAQYIVGEFSSIFKEITYINGHEMADTLARIQEKASLGQFKTLEQFHSAYQAIVFDTITKCSEECEETEVAQSMVKVVIDECSNLLACFECYSKSWGSDGRILSARDYAPRNTTPCKIPHVIIWAKEKGYPFWPAKLLACSNGKLIIQNFREKATVRHFSFPLQSSETLEAVLQFSVDFPGSSKLKRKGTWGDARADCDKYVKKLRDRFGEDGVVIPKKAEPFNADFDLETAMKRMFPTFQSKINEQDLEEDIHSIAD